LSRRSRRGCWVRLQDCRLLQRWLRRLKKKHAEIYERTSRASLPVKHRAKAASRRNHERTPYLPLRCGEVKPRLDASIVGVLPLCTTARCQRRAETCRRAHRRHVCSRGGSMPASINRTSAHSFLQCAALGRHGYAAKEAGHSACQCMCTILIGNCGFSTCAIYSLADPWQCTMGYKSCPTGHSSVVSENSCVLPSPRHN